MPTTSYQRNVVQHTKRITNTMRLYQILILFSFTCGFISNDTPTKILKGHEWSVTTLDINKTGDLLLSGAWDNKMILWDLSTNEMIYKFDNHSNMIWDVSFSNDDKYVASVGEDNLIKLWSIENNDAIATFTDNDKKELNAECFTHDDKMIIYGSQDKTIKFRDINKYTDLQ
jgi:WD40 repeat protein